MIPRDVRYFKRWTHSSRNSQDPSAKPNLTYDERQAKLHTRRLGLPLKKADRTEEPAEPVVLGIKMIQLRHM